MARFPTREAEVASLAGTMIYGLTEFAGDFPACPVTVETLQEALDRFAIGIIGVWRPPQISVQSD